MLKELEQAGALTETSLDLGSTDVSYDTYESLARFLGSLGRSYCWWVGDLINWGEMVFGETYAQAVGALGLSPGTCVNYAYTCRQVARSRRRPDVSFAHHRVVAPMEPDGQREWLEKVAVNGWTRSQLSEALAEFRGVIELQPIEIVDPLAVAESEDPPALRVKIMEVVRCFAEFSGDIGHSVRCFVRKDGTEWLDCVCGLERLEAALTALGVDW